ncbi:MAG: histidine phosphatase family protein [Desulfuromonadales bacterium]|nr:histidine phosphatase family protein [Desulfuromonadales bacterium]
MKRLTLIRHAKSDWNSTATTDLERPLNSRGEKAAPLMGQRLATCGWKADRLISSPAERALKTANLIARQLNYPEKKIATDQKIYAAGLHSLIDVIHTLDNADEHIVLFGHNPGFSELGQWLNPAAPDQLPTCAVLTFELPVKGWGEITGGCATILNYDFPKLSVSG